MLRDLLSRFRKRLYRYRSSITGLFVSKSYAERSPTTTTREEVR